MKTRKTYILLMSIVLIGIIARIMKFGDAAIVMDSVAYSRLGKNLIEGGRYVFGENYNMGVFFPPVYPAIIGIINLLFNDLLFSAKIVSFISSIATIFLSFLVGKELYNREAGLFAALVYALYPVVLIVSVDAYSDALFSCFLILSLYIFLLSTRKDKVLIYAFFGASTAISFLIRPEAMFILLIPILQMFGLFSKRIGFNIQYFFKVVLIFSIFLLVISPYMLFLKDYTGNFTLSGKGNISIILGQISGSKGYHEALIAPDNLYDRAAFTLNEDKTYLKGWNRKDHLSLKEYILQDPVIFLNKYIKNILREVKVLFKLLLPILVPLCFSFFSRGLFKDKRRLIFIVYPLILFFIYPMFIVIEKQVLILVFFLVFISSAGYSDSSAYIKEIANYLKMKDKTALRLLERNIKYIIIAILILSSMVYIKYSGFENTSKPIEHEKAGYFLKETVAPGYEELNIMERKPYVSFYSDSRFTMLPYAPSTDVINFAKLYKVDYIVVDDRSLSGWDFYNELTDMHKRSVDVDLIYEDNSEYPIKLFKINH
jgi:4-amino-4-deoxy-L-arabinose transferase-like glycosyltransferase